MPPELSSESEEGEESEEESDVHESYESSSVNSREEEKEEVVLVKESSEEVDIEITAQNVEKRKDRAPRNEKVTTVQELEEQ